MAILIAELILYFRIFALAHPPPPPYFHPLLHSYYIVYDISIRNNFEN